MVLYQLDYLLTYNNHADVLRHYSRKRKMSYRKDMEKTEKENHTRYIHPVNKVT